MITMKKNDKAMRNFLPLLLLFSSLSFYGQGDTIAVAKVSNVSEVYIKTENVLYVGIKNRIFIIIPNPETLTATSQGLTIEEGKYYISPNHGEEQTLYLHFKSNDGTFVNEKYIFKIKTIPIVMGFINDNNCEKCVVEMSKEELKDALITLKFYNNILPEMKFNVTGYTIIPLTGKKTFIEVKGNKITPEIDEILSKLKPGAEFYIWNFKFSHNLGSTAVCKTTPIRIRIVKP
jgi:hypothetical protein